MEKIFFKTFGCSNNFAETEMMKGSASENFEITENIEDADVVVLNICTVKGDDSSLSEIKKVKESFPYKKLIVAGCIPNHLIKKIRKIDDECALLTTHNIDQINDVIEEVINDHPIEVISKEKLIKVGKRIRKNKIVGIVPISNSCMGKCTYCSVRGVKGKYYSFPEENVLEEVKQAVSEGCKEIWITSQDNGCYGKDIDSSLSSLLKKVCDVEGEFLVRVGMMNPEHINDEIVNVFKNKKIFKFVHIPVQSGSNEILKNMGRKYTAEEFKECVEKFRDAIPNITLATDIIVGFPGEKDEDFQETLNLIRDVKPDIVNISKFRKRPGTPAAKMRRVNSQVVKERSQELNRVFDWIAMYNNRKWKGWEGGILIDEEGKEDTLIGRNAYYKQVIIGKNGFKIGDKVKVKVSRISKFYLQA